MEALPSDFRKTVALCFLLLIKFGIVVSESSEIDPQTSVSDNRPAFLKHNYEVVVRTKLPPLSNILQLRTMVKDSEAHDELSFKIESGSQGFFGINSKGAIVSTRSLDRENFRLFNMTVSLSDQGQPALTADRPAQVAVLVFQPFQMPVYFLKATYTTLGVQFNLKFLNTGNVAKYGIIVQRAKSADRKFDEPSAALEPLTWYQVNKMDGLSLRRYITAIVPSDEDIERKNMLNIVIGGKKDCSDKDDYCNGPLTPGHMYRFQLRVYIKNSGPFTDLTFKDSMFGRCLVVERRPALRN